MITNSVPCPVCGRVPQPEPAPSDKGTWLIGCVGARHCLQLYKGVSAEEVLQAWVKAFGPKEAAA